MPTSICWWAFSMGISGFSIDIQDIVYYDLHMNTAAHLLPTASDAQSLNDAKAQLATVVATLPGLADRLASVLGIDADSNVDKYELLRLARAAAEASLAVGAALEELEDAYSEATQLTIAAFQIERAIQIKSA